MEPDLFDRYLLKLFIRDLTEADKELIRSRSYKHPNGFVKVVLRRNSDGTYYRLHYWYRELAMDQNFHNHGWSFVSKILHGSLMETHYEPRESENGTVYKYTMDLLKRDGKLHVTQSEAKYEMVPKAVHEHLEGETYYLSSSVVHKAIPEAGTITLMLQFPTSEPECHVYSTDGISDGQHYESISMEELEHILQTTGCLIG